MNAGSSHTASSPAGAAPVPPAWLFALLAAGVLVWPLLEAAKNILCFLLVLGGSWRYGRYWHPRSWNSQQWLIVVTLVVLGLAGFLYPPAARGEWLDYFRYFSVFWVVLTLPWTEKQIRILWLMLGASLAVGLTDAVWEYFYLEQRRFFPELHAVGHVHPSSMYIGTAAVALATAGLVLSGKERWFLIMSAVACWFSLLFGEGRGNFVGGLAAILVCMALGYRDYRRQVAVTLLLLAATIALAVISDARIVQKGESLEERGDFFNGRIPLWKDTYAIWRSAPLLGIGPGELGKVSASQVSTMRQAAGLPETEAERGRPRYKEAHNLYLTRLVSHGIVGLVLLLAWLGVWAVALWKWRPRAGTSLYQRALWSGSAAAFTITIVIGTVNPTLHHGHALLAMLLYALWLNQKDSSTTRSAFSTP
jgi:O-antigen ligase